MTEATDAAIIGALTVIIICAFTALNNKLKKDAASRNGIRQDALVDLFCTLTRRKSNRRTENAKTPLESCID